MSLINENPNTFTVRCPRCGYVGTIHEFVRFDLYKCEDVDTVDCEVWIKCPKCQYEETIGRDYYPLK